MCATSVSFCWHHPEILSGIPTPSFHDQESCGAVRQHLRPEFLLDTWNIYFIHFLRDREGFLHGDGLCAVLAWQDIPVTWSLNT